MLIQVLSCVQSLIVTTFVPNSSRQAILHFAQNAAKPTIASLSPPAPVVVGAHPPDRFRIVGLHFCIGLKFPGQRGEVSLLQLILVQSGRKPVNRWPRKGRGKISCTHCVLFTICAPCCRGPSIPYQ